MAKKFKDYYDEETAKIIADKISSVVPSFDSKGFVGYITQHIIGKEFMERQDIFVDGFVLFLGSSYEKNVGVFESILGKKLETDTGMFIYGWWLWPIGKYVERYGTQNLPLSLNFIYELTQRFTGEFAIRPLLEQDPVFVLINLQKWSHDTSVHVRRLCSEGIRPKLPWAKASSVLVNHFDLGKVILDNLKNSPEKFVQKSVGNVINDLMKVAPDLANGIIQEWNTNPTKHTQWIIRHGTRSLRK